MTMSQDEIGHVRQAGEAAVLKQEAWEERPAFSEVFHDRLRRRLAATPVGSLRIANSEAGRPAHEVADGGPRLGSIRPLLPRLVASAAVMVPMIFGSIALLKPWETSRLWNKSAASESGVYWPRRPLAFPAVEPVEKGQDGRFLQAASAQRLITWAAVPPADSPIGIEQLPMFDEIEEGVVDGVKSLATTLLDVSDWTMLADFDPSQILGNSPATP